MSGLRGKHPGASGMVLDEDRIRLLDRIGMDWKMSWELQWIHVNLKED